MKNLQSIEKLKNSFHRLPGVGEKTAEKMAYSVLEMNDDNVLEFAKALENVKQKVKKCPICGTYTENDVCSICSDKTRDNSTLLVVSYPKDVISFENIKIFKGKYHVLGGVLSALHGISADDLNIASLIERISKENVKEVIVATNPTTEGEVTALYLAKVLEKTNVKITRLAYGLPMGGHLEYADSLTLSKSLEGRKKI